MQGTTFSEKDIKEFIEISDTGDYNIRFKVILTNGTIVPGEKGMTLNLSQIDNSAKRVLFETIQKQGLDIKTNCYIFEDEE